MDFGILKKNLEKLHRLKSTTNGWESSGAEPPNATAIETALEVIMLSCEVDFQPDHIDPSTDEGVCISIRQENKYADIECFNDGGIFAVVSGDDGDTDVWELQRDAIGIALQKIQCFMSSAAPAVL